jgi:hypothetical protein
MCASEGLSILSYVTCAHTKISLVQLRRPPSYQSRIWIRNPQGNPTFDASIWYNYSGDVYIRVRQTLTFPGLHCSEDLSLAARRWPHRRITIAMIYLVPTIIGNAILWKIPRDNKSGILGGLYIVSC